MNKLSPCALLAAVGALFGTMDQASAFGVPGCDVNVCCVEKTITCYRPEIRCREVPCTVTKTVCREVVEMKKTITPHPYTETQKREVYVYREVPEEVTRDVYVAVECPTCASGCDLCCKPNPASYKTTITCVECKPKAVKVEINELVCKVRIEEKLTPVTKTVAESVPETVVKKEYTCVMVPFVVTVTVPTCVSCGGGH